MTTSEQPAKMTLREFGIEVALAVVLGLASLASAWCAYESSLWGGIQTFRLANSNRAGRDAAQREMSVEQTRLLDASLVESYAEAISAKNPIRAKFIYEQFRPELKAAVTDWTASHSVRDPVGAGSPFEMKEYHLAAEDEAAQLRQTEIEKYNAAAKANSNSDHYMLLTVISGLALFLGGISSSFKSEKVRLAMLTASGVVIIALAFLIALQPPAGPQQ